MSVHTKCNMQNFSTMLLKKQGTLLKCCRVKGLKAGDPDGCTRTIENDNSPLGGPWSEFIDDVIKGFLPSVTVLVCPKTTSELGVPDNVEIYGVTSSVPLWFCWVLRVSVVCWSIKFAEVDENIAVISPEGSFEGSVSGADAVLLARMVVESDGCDVAGPSVDVRLVRVDNVLEYSVISVGWSFVVPCEDIGVL